MKLAHLRGMWQRDEGFSLIEGVVAIFLVAILLGLVVFAFNADQNQLSLTDAKAQSVVIANSILDATSASPSCGDLTGIDSLYSASFIQYCSVPTVGYAPNSSYSGVANTIAEPLASNGAPNIKICNIPAPNFTGGNLNLAFDSPSPWFCFYQTANKFLVQSTSDWANPSPPTTCPSPGASYAPQSIIRTVTEIASTTVDPQTFTYQRLEAFRPGSAQVGQTSPMSLIFTNVPSNEMIVLKVQPLPASNYDPSTGSLVASTGTTDYYFGEEADSNHVAAFPYLSDAFSNFSYYYAMTPVIPTQTSIGTLSYSQVQGPNQITPTVCVTM